MSSSLVIAKLISIDGTRAIASVGDRQASVSLALVPDAETGDEVLIYHGFALRRMSEASEAVQESAGEGMDLPPGDFAADL